MKMRKKQDSDLTLADLEGAPWNPRTISVEALNGLVASEVAYGDISGIVFNRRMGIVICGHQRLKGLRKKYGDKLKTEVKRNRDGAIITMQIKTPDGNVFGVRVVDWSDTKSIGANLTANSELISGQFTEATEELVDRVAREDPLISRATLVDQLFIPDLQRPETGELVDQKKLDAEEQPEQPKLDRNYFYVQCYGEPERFARLTARLRSVGMIHGPHEVDQNWFEKTVFGCFPTPGPEGEGGRPKKKKKKKEPFNEVAFSGPKWQIP